MLRAAQSEVEHYTRIEFGMIDRDIEVAAHAVNDLVHLVAELFDNATAFSPPDAVVLVEARRIGDRAVLYVEDRGIGISADQLADLNERLATPPIVDVAVSRMMGLVVVARLADRHGVKVELRPAAERGTVADVLLPTVGAGAAGARRPRRRPDARRCRAPPALEPMRPAAAPVRRCRPSRRARRSAPPLALESGPAGGRAPRRRPRSNGARLRSARAASAASPPTRRRSARSAATCCAVGRGAPRRTLPSWSDLTGAGDAAGRQRPAFGAAAAARGRRRQLPTAPARTEQSDRRAPTCSTTARASRASARRPRPARRGQR